MFELGNLYFRVTYPDPEGLFPGVETFIFIGKNLSDEDIEDTWYFQPARDYFQYGSAVKNNGLAVVCVDSSSASEMLDVSRLHDVLSDAADRLRNERSSTEPEE